MMEGTKEKVAEVLRDFSGLGSAKELFSELNYDIARDSLPRRDWGKAAKEALVEDPQIIATHGDFRIIYGKFASDRLLITPQRAVINTLLREHPYALFVFSTEDEKSWHFVNVKLVSGEEADERNKDAKKRRLFRRITIREKETRLWTATKRISMLDLALIQPELFGGIPPLTIQSEHDKAFDVEAVTKEFYDAYEGVFKTFWKDLEEQTRDRRWAHDYSLQFLNRLMFLYFVQRKGWLAEDNEFLETFWRTYRKSGEPKDTFFEKWLKVLFFEAFNNQKNLLNTKQREYLPEDIRKALWEAPYLNGGLFKKNKLDEPTIEFQISDSRFGQIFNLFQKYNFTITEDSPLDQEVAVDPEMIGKVYESLVNLTEAGMERSAAGIFYTPRTEIDLMCRLSIVDNLANYIGQQHKNLLYEAVFSLDQEDKEQADKALAKAKLWPDVEKRLNEITVLDPACGSGSFLVGMLYILNDLLERAEAQRGEHTSSYERRKQIIGQSLYGVDVMDWACHVAELRLWLALIVDAEFTKEELTIREEPLLPHFSFKVRCGDSLVQEVGGVDMAHWRGVLELSQNMKRRLRELKNEKSKFYSNDPSCKFKAVEALESQEVLIFRELLQDRVKTLDNQAKDLMRIQAEKRAHRQYSLTGELEGAAEQFTLERENRERQIQALMEEKTAIESVANNLRDKTSVPFVWDISFAETFSGDRRGFDIVIGNPPYLRQERIADPNLTQEEVTTENKKVYKAKLMRSVYKEYPSFFKYKTATDKATHKIDAKSDLYIYFYFYGLSLLNDKGSFCFITSNSWLDVGYGRDLQEFLLKRCHTKLVIDNKVKRTFKPADINTIIVLFGPPADSKIKDDVALKRTAKFVMFYVPFEEALHPVVFEEIEEFSEKTTRPEYRVFPIKQDELLADGCEIPKEAEGKQSRGPLIKTAKYIGNKWGGRYLRAPDIYWTVLEKYRDKLMRLDKAAEISRGITTGCNEFFFLEPTGKKLEDGSVPVTNDGGWSGTLEENTLCFAVQKVDECDMPVFEPKKFLFCPPDNLPRRAASYIQYGEKMGYNRRATCKARSKWWKLPTDKQNAPLIGFNYNIYDTGRSYISSVSPTYYSDSFHVLRCNDLEVLHGYMHSTFFHFLINVDARTVFGGGKAKLQTFELQDLYCIKEFANIANTKDFAANYKKFCSQEDNYLIDNLSDPLRLSLDEIVFDILGLTQGEREAVYEAVIDLVESRLKKAESLR